MRLTRKDFRDRLKPLHLSISDFSKICGVGYSTARDWHEIPKWVPFVLSHLELMQVLKTDYEELESITKKLHAFEAIRDITKNL